jgi:hypothetical protein
MHQDPSGMLARIPFGLTTGPIEGAEILVAGCRKETVASEMRSNVLKYRDTLLIPHFIPTRPTQRKSVPPLFTAMYTSRRGDPWVLTSIGILGKEGKKEAARQLDLL